MCICCTVSSVWATLEILCCYVICFYICLFRKMDAFLSQLERKSKHSTVNREAAAKLAAKAVASNDSMICLVLLFHKIF